MNSTCLPYGNLYINKNFRKKSNMSHFGISKNTEKSFRNKFFKNINVGFLIVLFLFFSIFSFYSKITEILFEKEKIDVFKEDLTEI